MKKLNTEQNTSTSDSHLNEKSETSKGENICRTESTKICTKCNVEKPLDEFYFYTKRNRYFSCCKVCDNIRGKAFRNSHKEQEKNYYKKNRDKKIKYSSEYGKLNKEIRLKKALIRTRIRKQEDIKFRFICNLRSRLNNYFKCKKSKKTLEYLGCTTQELKVYISSMFIEGMTLENYGEWHLDHIYPLSKVDITNEEELKRVLHYTNLQPLWAKDNISKGNKIQN